MTYSAEVLADSPLAWWRLDEASGSTFADSSGNSRSLSITGSPTFGGAAPGVGLNKSVAFSGSEYASIAAPSWFTAGSAWSLECWVKTSTASLAAGILTRDDISGSSTSAARMIELELSSGKAALEVFDSGGGNFVLAAATMTDGAWRHLVMTYGAGVATLYVNGASIGTCSLTAPLSPGTGVPLLLGATYQAGSFSRKMVGSLAEPAVYGTTLSAARVLAHYNAGISTSTSGTAAAAVGGVTASATGRRTTFAVAAATIGALVVTASGLRTVPRTATATLGGVTAAASSVHTTPGTAASALGALTAAASGIRTAPGTASALLGTLACSATGVRTAPGTAAVLLGPLTATATGSGTTPGRSATFTFGRLALAADASARAISGSASFVFGSISGAAVGGVAPTPRIAPILTATGRLPSLALFDVDAHTKICNLHPGGGKWQNVLNEAGNLSFRLPMDDPTTLLATGKRWVKGYWKGGARIAARLDVATTDLAVDGRRWRVWDAIPGALVNVKAGIVWPEYGQRPTNTNTRTFGPMSKRDAWYINADWTWAIELAFAADTGFMKGWPTEFRGTGACRISKTGVYDIHPAGTKAWYRRQFTTYTTFDWEMIIDAGIREIWVDGEQLYAAGTQSVHSWRYVQRVQGTFHSGNHTIAVLATSSAVGGDATAGPIAIIGALYRLNANGEHVAGPPFLVTDWRWRVAVNVAGHRWGEMLALLWEEATLRQVRPIEILTRSWTDLVDSNSVPWETDGGGQQTVELGRNYLDVMQQFTEAGMDIDVSAPWMQTRAFQRKGVDRSATLHFLLGSGDTGSLKAHKVTRTEATSNSALIQLADGSWTVREDAASIDAYGREEIGLSIGTTPETATAHRVADAQFNETAHPTRSFQSQTSTGAGPQPYDDYDIGDEGMVPDENGTGEVKARIVTITVDWDNSTETVQAWPDFEEDRT